MTRSFGAVGRASDAGLFSLAAPSATHASRVNAGRASQEPRDTTGFASSGQSPGASSAHGERPAPKLHLVGAGKVGREFLARLAKLPVCLTAVSDSSGTVYDRNGIDGVAVLRHKAQGGRIAELAHAEAIPTELAIGLCAAEIVVDATPTDFAGTEAAVERVRAALRTGAFVALCGKNALAAQAAGWLQGATRNRFGVDASFGGAGAQLLRELDELRARAEGLAVVGNVTTTVVIEAIERGGSLDDGLAAARARGLLESDPRCDLDGSDAACKLVAVFGAVFGESYLRAPALAEVVRADLRELAPAVLRERHARGATTRLVGRAERAGALRVAFEEVPVASPLAAPADRVVYGYRLPEGLRVHVGAAVGADRTAAALCGDVLRAVRAEVRS